MSPSTSTTKSEALDISPPSTIAPPEVCTVPVSFGRVIVLSAVGSVIVKVVSNSSAVAPSNTIALAAFIVIVSTIVCVPLTVKLPATVRLSATVTSEVPCPIVTTIPEVSVASFKAPVLFVIYESEPS